VEFTGPLVAPHPPVHGTSGAAASPGRRRRGWLWLPADRIHRIPL